MKEYPVQRAAVLKPKPDPDTLVFGKTFTDHMFIMDYTAGQGWHDGRIVPYGPLALEPSAMVLHYAQERPRRRGAALPPHGERPAHQLLL